MSQNCILTEKATRTGKPAIPAQGGNSAQDAVAAINRPEDLKLISQTVNCMLLWLLYKQDVKINCTKS